MKGNRNSDYFSIQPPKLEDAGLEDPALAVEEIKEAFRRVAGLVQTKAEAGVQVQTASDGAMEDTVVDPLPEPEKEGKPCIDPVTDGALPGEHVIVAPPDQSNEVLVLEKEEKGPNLGEEKCVVGDTDPERDTHTL